MSEVQTEAKVEAEAPEHAGGIQLPPEIPPISDSPHMDAYGLVEHMKAWVRRELSLLHDHGMGHEERAKHNP